MNSLSGEWYLLHKCQIDISTLHTLSTNPTQWYLYIYLSSPKNLLNIDNFNTTRTSHKSVFKVDKQDEDGVEDGERGDELVEGGVHLLGGEHQHGQQVPQQPEHAHHRLTQTNSQTGVLVANFSHWGVNDISRKFSQNSKTRSKLITAVWPYYLKGFQYCECFAKFRWQFFSPSEIPLATSCTSLQSQDQNCSTYRRKLSRC